MLRTVDFYDNVLPLTAAKHSSILSVYFQEQLHLQHPELAEEFPTSVRPPTIMTMDPIDKYKTQFDQEDL